LEARRFPMPSNIAVLAGTRKGLQGFIQHYKHWDKHIVIILKNFNNLVFRITKPLKDHCLFKRQMGFEASTYKLNVCHDFLNHFFFKWKNWFASWEYDFFPNHCPRTTIMPKEAQYRGDQALKNIQNFYFLIFIFFL